MSSKKYRISENSSNLAKNLRNILKARKISQRKFAPQIAVSVGYLNDILTGRYTAGPQLVALIAERLHLSVGKLLGTEISEAGSVYFTARELKKAALDAAVADYAEDASEEDLDHLIKYIALFAKKSAANKDKKSKVKSSDDPTDDPVKWELEPGPDGGLTPTS